jgi:hypothetical protein
MSPDEPRRDSPPPAPPVASAAVPPDAPAPAEGAAANALTPEEQMALYAQDLKENDWGHQPC